MDKDFSMLEHADDLDERNRRRTDGKIAGLCQRIDEIKEVIEYAEGEAFATLLHKAREHKDFVDLARMKEDNR